MLFSFGFTCVCVSVICEESGVSVLCVLVVSLWHDVCGGLYVWFFFFGVCTVCLV